MGDYFYLRPFDPKQKTSKYIQSLTSKSDFKLFTKSTKIEKRKKDALNLKATPHIHISKRTTKIPQPIPRSRILIIFKIFYMTSCLVGV